MCALGDITAPPPRAIAHRGLWLQTQASLFPRPTVQLAQCEYLDLDCVSSKFPEG